MERWTEMLRDVGFLARHRKMLRTSFALLSRIGRRDACKLDFNRCRIIAPFFPPPPPPPPPLGRPLNHHDAFGITVSGLGKV